MENQETIIEIRGISIKEGKSGNKYFSIETDNGNVTCFEKKIIDELQKHVGEFVKVEIVANDRGFKNLRKFCGIAAKTEITSAPKKEEYHPDYFKDAREEKNKSMFVSYVKDLVVSGMPVENAIVIIKTAISAFEDKVIKEEEVL